MKPKRTTFRTFKEAMKAVKSPRKEHLFYRSRGGTIEDVTDYKKSKWFKASGTREPRTDEYLEVHTHAKKGIHIGDVLFGLRQIISNPNMERVGVLVSSGRRIRGYSILVKTKEFGSDKSKENARKIIAAGGLSRENASERNKQLLSIGIKLVEEPAKGYKPIDVGKDTKFVKDTPLGKLSHRIEEKIMSSYLKLTRKEWVEFEKRVSEKQKETEDYIWKEYFKL